MLQSCSRTFKTALQIQDGVINIHQTLILQLWRAAVRLDAKRRLMEGFKSVKKRKQLMLIENMLF